MTTYTESPREPSAIHLQRSSLRGTPVLRVLRSYHFWIVVAMFAAGTVLHYPALAPHLFPLLGLGRHAMERVAFLLPITYAGFVFGSRAGVVSAAAALGIMLPRVFLLSPSPRDALVETSVVVIVGVLVNLWFGGYIRQRVRAEQAMASLEAAQKELSSYLGQITRVQEEERKRIARELHDETAQDLVTLSRQVDTLISKDQHLLPCDIAILEDLRQQVDRTLDGVRRFSQDLRPSILDDLGLLPALEWLCSQVGERFGIVVEMKVSGQAHRLTPEVELALFRIAQEGLSNVGKHSEASKARVTIHFEENGAIMTIEDDGKGFELPARTGDLARIGKLGLVGMQERARLVGGSLEIYSESGRGTALTVLVPARQAGSGQE